MGAKGFSLFSIRVQSLFKPFLAPPKPFKPFLKGWNRHLSPFVKVRLGPMPDLKSYSLRLEFAIVGSILRANFKQPREGS